MALLAELDRLAEMYEAKAFQILTILNMTLTTGKLSTMGEHFLVAPIKSTLRTLCLGLTRLRLQNSTDKSTGIPFTRVDPAAIEEAFPKLTVREFQIPFPRVDPVALDKDFPKFTVREEFTVREDLQDAVLISVRVSGYKMYLFATLTSDGADVAVRETSKHMARNASEIYNANVLYIGNSLPFIEPYSDYQ